MDLGLQGKRVLVTASTAGLGLASALEFAKEGAVVTISSRDGAKANEVAAELRAQTDATVHAFEADVSRREELEALVSHAVEAMGGLDILVCNAGGPPPGNFQDLDLGKWEQAFRLTLMSVVHSVELALPHLEAQGGAILAFGSSSVKEPIPNLLLSNVFRPAVRGLLKHLASELAPRGIRVNFLSPGRILTDRTRQLDAARAARENRTPEEVQRETVARIPLGRMGEPAEFGKVAAFLCSEAASYITGESWLVDGGMVKSL
jgi:3-oxoacyl-[acyl-carrier protein] reductase